MRGLLPLSAVGLALVLAAAPEPAAAQWRAVRFDAPPPAERMAQPDARSPWRPLRLAKYGTAALAVGTGVWGFLVQEDADDAYRALEDRCAEEPDLCRELLDDGSYADPTLEGEYQAIREDYRTARFLLVGSQVVLAASVALFILDLPGDGTEPNIPYEPERLRLGVGARDGALLLGGIWIP